MSKIKVIQTRVLKAVTNTRTNLTTLNLANNKIGTDEEIALRKKPPGPTLPLSNYHIMR